MNDSDSLPPGLEEVDAKPKASLGQWLGRWMVGIAVLGLAAAVLSRWDYVTPLEPAAGEAQSQPFRLDSVTILRPSLQMVAEWFAWPGCSLLLAAGGLFGLFRRRWFWGSMNLAVSLVLIPVLFFVGFATNLSPYSVTSQLTGSDGRTYAFLDSEFLQGQTLALGVQVHPGIFTVTYHEVGSTNGDSPQSWAAVVRPDGATGHYGQLYVNKEGFIVGFRYGCHAYFAYDTKSGHFLGHGPIEGISPFVLIDEDVRMNPQDVETIASGKEAVGSNGVPHREHLVAATGSDRSDIRQAAARIISSQGLSARPSDPPQ